MWDLILFVSWFLLGGLSFFYKEVVNPSKTRGEYVSTLILFSLGGYMTALIGFIRFIHDLKENSTWWNEKI